MSPEAIVKSLQERYGEDRVELRSDSGIFIFVCPSGTKVRVAMILTLEQAEFLALHPISPDDLVKRNYPPGWPAR